MLEEVTEAEQGWFWAGTRIGTPFPLLKVCLRTHYGRYCEQFFRRSALDCKILHIQSQKISKYLPGVISRSSTESSRCLDSDINFRLARQRSHCSCFSKRPLKQRWSWLSVETWVKWCFRTKVQQEPCRWSWIHRTASENHSRSPSSVLRSLTVLCIYHAFY